MRFLLPVLWWLAFVYTCSAAEIAVDCCTVWQAFVDHIQSATDTNPTSCDTASVCTSSRLQTLLHQSNAFHSNVMAIQEHQVMITFNSSTIADLLVLSMLGRLVTKQDKSIAEESYAHYVYNEMHNTLQPMYSNCTFEKEMYVTLLCVTVIVLVVLLVAQLDQEEPPAPETPPLAANLASQQTVAFKIPLANSTVRYRPVATH